MNVTRSPLASASHPLPPSPRLPRLSQVLDYDYYGAYGRQRHGDYTYNRLLGDEYTFDFPPHHDIVSGAGSPSDCQGTGGALEAAEPVPHRCFGGSW